MPAIHPAPLSGWHRLSLAVATENQEIANEARQILAGVDR
jgi:hypothetical protein